MEEKSEVTEIEYGDGNKETPDYGSGDSGNEKTPSGKDPVVVSVFYDCDKSFPLDRSTFRMSINGNSEQIAYATVTDSEVTFQFDAGTEINSATAYWKASGAVKPYYSTWNKNSTK